VPQREPKLSQTPDNAPPWWVTTPPPPLDPSANPRNANQHYDDRRGDAVPEAKVLWKGVGMSTIVSGTLASAIVEYRSEQNRLPDRSLGTFVGIDLNARCPSA
jgi:hypothetical protein